MQNKKDSRISLPVPYSLSCTDNIFIFQIRSTTTSNRLTNSTKSRISSIFSSTVDSIKEDDTFDLKASARKLKPIRESIVNTGRLVDIDFAE